MRSVTVKHRLIPACAGKTWARCSFKSPQQAHPRVCGENVVPRALAGVTAGSSPRVRGKLEVRLGGGGNLGLIPACAGKTAMLAAGAGLKKAHPRVCGENLEEFAVTPAPFGSSPRVRGKQQAACVGITVSGLIPACAGKTAAASLGSVTRGAHPRVCGENRTSEIFR